MDVENDIHEDTRENSMHNGTLFCLLSRLLGVIIYFNKYDYALGIRGASWESWGELRWEMTLCLLVAWIFSYFCVIKGIATMGKIVYFTTIFPFLILTALLIRGVTLPGAYEGIIFYITPRWELLYEAKVWGDAASQVFYAMGIGCGSLVTLASYNKFENNCYRDALLIGLVITITSIFAGFAVFSILGFMAHQLGVPVDEVVQSGPGLAFIAYPEAVLQMPLPQLWAVLFFLMLFILGQGTQFAGIEAINTAILDQWPGLRQYTYLVTAGISVTGFILALPMCCSGGVFLFTLLDWNCSSWALIIIGLMELVVTAHVYGASLLIENIKAMEIHLSWFAIKFWWFMLLIVAPLLTTGVVVFTLSEFTNATYGDYNFPPSIDVLGYLISVTTLAPLPCFAVYQMIKNYRNKEGLCKALFNPSHAWGPKKSIITADSHSETYSLTEL